MKNLINRNVNDVFDEIIRKRRSIRSFKSIIPSKEIIKEIITAGAYAPYAALAVTDISQYRRFYVFTKYPSSAGTSTVAMSRFMDS